MKDFNTMFVGKVLNVYKGSEGLKSLADGGGGNGSIIKAVLYIQVSYVVSRVLTFLM